MTNLLYLKLVSTSREIVERKYTVRSGASNIAANCRDTPTAARAASPLGMGGFYVVELVGIDLVDWQKEHPFRLSPSVSEYVKRSTKGKPEWCEP